MKVLFALDKEEINPYISEITNYFNKLSIEYVLSAELFWESDISFDIIHIHWPEALFHWKEINKERLEKFKKRFFELKNKSKIVYTYHDEKTHYKDAVEIYSLFNFILKHSDAVIHLGEKSFKILISNNEISNINVIIPHPYYLTYPNSSTFESARKELNIALDRFVVLVFGEMRSVEEIKFVFKVLKKTNIKKLTLLTGKWKPQGRNFVFNSRIFKKILIKYFWLIKRYKINFNYVKKEDVHFYFNSADVVFIPRSKNLNSGVLFLGLSFRKIVIGPRIGNIEETLNFLDFPSFGANNILEASNALQKAKNLLTNQDFFNNYQKKISIYDPRIISYEHMKLYYTLINKYRKK